MITDFVRDDIAYLRCTECGAETRILVYYYDEGIKSPMIDMPKSVEALAYFKLKHLLCKPLANQTEMFKDEHEELKQKDLDSYMRQFEK